MIALSGIDRISELIAEMSEEDAKKQLAEIYTSIAQIGIHGYSEKQCLGDIRNMYRRNITFKITRDTMNAD